MFITEKPAVKPQTAVPSKSVTLKKNWQSVGIKNAALV